MIKPSVKLERYAPQHLRSKLSDEFSLICWNVYKKIHRPKQIEYLKHMLSSYKPELLVLQESPRIIDISKQTSVLHGYEQYYFSNLEFKKKAFGLLTASVAESIHSNYVISQYKEFILRTHKAFLVSIYPLASNEQLMLINVHAINFRRVQIYQKELEQVYEFAKNHQGPLIIAGDFNSWGSGRLLLLNKLINQLNLERVEFKNAKLIKRFLNVPLDHIFYRGLSAQKAEVLDCWKLSDHNPLFVSFR